MSNKTERLTVKQGCSFHAEAKQAVAELSAQILQEDMRVVVFFCASTFNLDDLGAELKQAFDCPVIGCTSSGEITSEFGYQEGSLIGISLSSKELIVHPFFIHPLNQFDHPQSEALLHQLRQQLAMSAGLDAKQMFGMLLIDGLSMLEEQVVATLYSMLGNIPVLGGSAGDDLSFVKTKIYNDGQFVDNAAMFALFETTLPFKVFRSQHFEPTDIRLVITEADPATRTVTEINGEPAAEEFARLVGLELQALTPQMFATFPVMLRVGGEYFVRSIQKANPDGSLTFYCAIDTGLVLTIAKGNALLDNIQQNLDLLQKELPNYKIIIGCDCILRRVELAEKGWLCQASAILKDAKFMGFSTYGEQFNGIHVNQTLTGVAIGE